MWYAPVKRCIGRWIFNHYYRAKYIFPDRYFVFRFPWGRIYLNPRACRAMVARIFDIYETEKMTAIRELLKPGDVFVDVGGNMGDFSLLAAHTIGSSGQVLCFEAEPTNAYWIKRSLELNDYRNVSLFPVALSDRNGTAELHLGDRCDYHSLLNDSLRTAGTITIPTRTLDAVIKDTGISRVNVMKIDVEGAEFAVLNGAVETLENNPHIVLLLELHPEMKEAKTANVLQFLRDCGFSFFQSVRPFILISDGHINLRDVIASRTEPS